MELEHWNKYYNINNVPFESSDFSKFVMKKIKKYDSLVDVGCGNGRDSIYFASKKIRTTGIDQSNIAISNLEKVKNENLEFICSDFKSLNFESDFDHGYARFYFHAVNEDEQNDTLIWLSKNIKSFLFVENRILAKSENFSLPKDHFRRIEHQEKLIDGIKSYGFKLEYKKISTEFSKYKSSYNVSDIKSDPLLIRLIFSKNEN